MLFSEPKIPQYSRDVIDNHSLTRVSVLFSEPKIPQSSTASPSPNTPVRFSALQRAENSSMNCTVTRNGGKTGFQCSSASRKFLNLAAPAPYTARRAFQCSSASRKFLNVPVLQHNSAGGGVSVLFSEPKIPQSTTTVSTRSMKSCFSALQRAENSSMSPNTSPHSPSDCGFSALQRAENSSIYDAEQHSVELGALFQCSSASRKFLNVPRTRYSRNAAVVSVLFSEPKIPQFSS